jgi:hypothetical protein
MADCLPYLPAIVQAREVQRALAAAFVLAGCGGNDDILAKLNALPGVTATESVTQTPGFHYYVLQVTQLVDHTDPQGATFQQEVSLLHKDTSSPLVVHTSGYWDYYLDTEVELTALVDGNQISIEHRFFGTSRPDPADWTKLTIEQMADDEHAIIAALRTIYTGPTLTTGASKGGMTAVYHRRFFPDDVDGTVPYVAPISFGAPDHRYAPFLDTLGPDTCRQQVRDVATEMLAHRRAALESATMTQAAAESHAYTRIAIGPAVESAVDGLEWAFWQYFGVTQCARVPDVTATDLEMFSFLDDVSPPSDNDDEQVGLFEAYDYQAYYQLGYPDGGAAYLTSLLKYTDADYNGALPTPMPPAYDHAVAMDDISSFVMTAGDRLLFVYGQWDPWTGGEFDLGAAADSLRLIQAQGDHDSRITDLSVDDRTTALGKLAAWTGNARVAPHAPALRPPRIPSAMRRTHHEDRGRGHGAQRR